MQTGGVIGSLDELTVRKESEYLTFWDSTTLVAACTIQVTGIIDDIWIADGFRGQKLLTKMLLFIKHTLGHPKIVFGTVHSSDTQNLLRGGGLKLFKKYWQNSHGETRAFSPENMNDFYGPGRWQLVLENTEDFGIFLKHDSFTHSWSALANIADLHESITPLL